MSFHVGAAANIFTAEGNTLSAARVSAPWVPTQWVISNDTSGINMGVRLHGAASTADKELTLGGLETLSIYFRQRTIEVSCNTSVAGGLGYRVWAFG